MLLSEFIKDFGVKKYFRSPKNLNYSLLANFIQLVLEESWVGHLTIQKDFSQNADIVKYFRILDPVAHPERDTLRFGDMYIILSPDRYRYGVFLNSGAVLEQPNHLNPQHEVLKDDIQKHITWVKSKGYEVVLLRPLNEKNIFPSDDLRYIKQDKPFAHVQLDVKNNKYVITAPGNHVTYSDPIWASDPTNKQIEVLAKQEIYRPLWLHVLDKTDASTSYYTGTYDGTHFTTWEVPTTSLGADPLMFALLRRSTTDYTTDDIKWTEAIPKRPIFYNPKDFGAAGDNTHDDTQAIKDAVAAAHAAGGGTVYATAGNYKLTDVITLPAGVNIQGDGRGATFFNQTGTNKRVFALAGGTDNIYADLFMADFTANANGTAAVIYLEASALWTVWLRDVSAINAGSGHGFQIRGAVVSRLEGLIGTSANGDGIFVDGLSSFSTSVFMSSCFGLSNTNGAGIHLARVVYFALAGCANDFNNVGYYFYNCIAGQIHAGGESNQTTYKVESTIDFSTRGLVFNGCYSYDTKGKMFDIIGYSQAVLIGCLEVQPHAGATASLHVDGNSKVTEIANTFPNPRVFDNGSKHVNLADIDGDSHLNNVDVFTLRDINGKRFLVPQETVNAVNYFTMVNAIAGHSPLFYPDGPDADIPLYIGSKGNAPVRISDPFGAVFAEFQKQASFVNLPYFLAANTGNAVEFGVEGTDTDITLNLVPKGAGQGKLGGKVIRTVAPVTKTITSNAAPAFDANIYEQLVIAALATNITNMSTNWVGTMYHGQTFNIYIQDDGTPRTIAWGSRFINSGKAGLLATTVANKVHRVTLTYDSAIDKLVCYACDDVGR